MQFRLRLIQLHNGLSAFYHARTRYSFSTHTKIPVPKGTGIVHALTGVFCYARVAATPETVKLTFAASGLTLPDAVRARTVSW